MTESNAAQTQITDVLAAFKDSAQQRPFTRGLFNAILESIGPETSYTALQAIIHQYIHDIQHSQVLLQEVLTKVDALQTGQAQEQYDGRWWEQARHRLHTAFVKDPQRGFAHWIKAYAGCLVAWRLDTCVKLRSEPFAFPPQAAKVLDLLKRGTDAIQNGPYPQAIEMIECLLLTTLSGEAESRLEETSRATLLILIGRIYLYKAARLDLARKQFEHARDVAPKNGRPYAALGEYYRLQATERATPDENGLVNTEYDHALQMYQQAIQLPSGQVEGYVGRGLILEAQRAWDEADDNYKKAIQELQTRVGTAELSSALSALLAPVSGNLYLQLARMLRKDEPQLALQAVNRALELVKDQGHYQERLAYRHKGEILDILIEYADAGQGQERKIEAAKAFFEAGKLFGLDKEYRLAIDLLGRAQTLNPDHTPTYWFLSDYTRLSAHRTEPPYPDAKRLGNSLTIWQLGADREFPDHEFAWAYSTRSLINEALADLPGENQWEREWEAITFYECEWNLHDPLPASTLAQCYQSVGAVSTALKICTDFLERNPDPSFASIRVDTVMEICTTLVNLGEFARAEELIGILQQRGPDFSTDAETLDNWCVVVKAFILLRTGDHRKALEYINAAIKTANQSLWHYRIRAECYEQLNERELAVRDYRWLRNRYDWQDRSSCQDKSSRSACAWAMYRLNDGELDRAIEILRGLHGQVISSGIKDDLGLCLLLLGERAEGVAELTSSISQKYNGRELNDLLRFEFPYLKKSVAERADAEQILMALEDLTQLIRSRIDSIRSRGSAEQELEDIVRSVEDTHDVRSWAWVGASAGLARLYTENQRWHHAARQYHVLLRSERFPHARYAMEKVADRLSAASNGSMNRGDISAAIEGFRQASSLERELGRVVQQVVVLRRLGDALLRANRLDEARERFVEALSIQSNTADITKREVGLNSRIGFVSFYQGDREDARTRFAKAMERYRQHGIPDAGAFLGEVCRALLQDTDRYWRLETEWKQWANDAGTSQTIRQNLLSARQALGLYLDELYKLRVDPAQLFLPVVTPITAEFADNLVPKVDTRQDSGKFLHGDIPAMRDRIRNDTGVVVPGVRARRNSKLAPGGYVIMLDEIPMASGTAQVDMGYCPVHPDTLRSLGISIQTSIPAPNPETGEIGCWIPRDQWDTVSNGLEPWTETGYIIHHLETVLRRNLVIFLDMQELESLLNAWGQNESIRSQLCVALPDESSRLAFAQLLRALVRERVPITNPEQILRAMQDKILTSDSLSDTVRRARLYLKRQLPGNSLDIKRVEILPEVENRIASWYRHENGKRFFAAPTQEASQLLSQIRNWIPLKTPNVVLITRDPEVRPLVRALIEAEFPDLMVLSSEEVLSQDELLAEAKPAGQSQILRGDADG